MDLITSLISQAAISQSQNLKPHDETEHGYHPSNTQTPLERGIFDSCRHPVRFHPTDEPCSNFFQQTGAIEFKSYIRLKQEERLAVVQFHAATKIQAAFRGFLLRSNLKILDIAAIKIQSLIRGFLARRKYRAKLLASQAQMHREKMIKAATKIQAWWRGILSRKNKFDFKRYKEIQEKNKALQRSIERINELEQALLKSLDPRESCESSDCVSLTRSSRSQSQYESSSSGQDPCAGLIDTSPAFSLTNLSPSLEKFIINKLPEVVDEMSETRITELYAYLASLETEMKTENELEILVKKVGGTQNLNLEDLNRLEESRRNQRERANVILSLAKMGLMGNQSLKQDMLLREKDSVDAMFPPIPDRVDVVQPDRRKVEALKDAIRMFRRHSKVNETRELQRMHVLLRTRACPGVYSDIYTTELTQIEQKLKALKFWKRNVVAESRMKMDREARNTRLKHLFAHALRITNLGDEEEEEPGEVEESEGTTVDEYEEYCGENEMGPEDEGSEDGNEGNQKKKRCYYLPPLDPQPPPPSPDSFVNYDEYEEDSQTLLSSSSEMKSSPDS